MATGGSWAAPSRRVAGGGGGRPGQLETASLPWEVLLQIFSYLDVSSLLCAGCVNKSFYQVSNDNLIWHRIYCSHFACKRKAWKPKAVDIATENLSRISIQDSPAGFWKKEYIRKCAGLGTRGVGQLLKPINRYTGLPSKCKEAVKALGITWIVVLRERNGKEHVKEQSKAYFSDTSVTLCWNSAVWPSLSSLKALCMYGVTPLFHPSKTPAMNGPRRRSLLAEYNLTNLEESSTYIGGDKLVKLQCLCPGMLLGCWQEDGELAVVVATLHFHQLIEKSTLGSATRLYSPPPHEPVLDDIDQVYGLHGYHCHITLHSGKSSFMSGSFHNLFCRKGNPNNFLQHLPGHQFSSYKLKCALRDTESAAAPDQLPRRSASRRSTLRFGIPVWTCLVSNSTFCFNSQIPTRVGKMELVDLHKRKTETITVTESIKENLTNYLREHEYTIQPLSTYLGKERQWLEVIAVVYYNLEQQSKMLQDEIDDINDSTWWEDLWNWGSNVQIHPWFRIISHVLIVVLGIMVLYVTYLIWKLKKLIRRCERMYECRLDSYLKGNQCSNCPIKDRQLVMLHKGNCVTDSYILKMN
ncbi:F-box only protein 15 isoform X2 [Heterodontus francisci]|uniref:F-box only protein 15 isoform X2 n=1 Tax=Heterodontus francisci TaxID=7792 RepID=UPI00355BE33F